MRIAIDGVRLSRKPSGVTFIVVSIIKQLAIEKPNFEIYVLLRSSIHPLLEDVFIEPNIKLLVSPVAVFNSKSLAWSLFKLNRVVSEIKPDYFIAPYTLLYPFFLNNNVKKIVFVHDLVFREWPGTMSFFNKVQMKALFEFSIKKASLIWCNSNYTKNELLHYYPGNASDKPIFVGSGLNVDFKEVVNNYEQEDRREITGKAKPYIIFVGTLEPRKNVPFLLNVFKHIAATYDLIIVGGKGWGNAEKMINEELKGGTYPESTVKILNNVKLIDLVSLYKNADFYLTTSVNEGLGLPLLEAMACGCPVIAAHNSAMIEVVEGAGITVKTYEVDDWLKAVALMEMNRAQYITQGYERVKMYNWASIIKKFVQLLK